MDNGPIAFNPILQTKLHRPQLTADLVNRNSLIEVMNRVRELPLTLVSAPAGYGKSVLVAQWCEQLDFPTAWLSLDADDSDLRTFLEYFLAAIDGVVPNACKASRDLLEAVSPLPVQVVANYLLNDLDAMDTLFTMVLDDYHRIEALSPVQELMRCMLVHPPRKFHFIILTRHDPPLDLASLRAGHSINDVRLQDLRFTATEIGEFLNVKQDFSINDVDIKTLDFKVEGWVAGLRLVAMALRHTDDHDTFFKGLQGSLPQIQDYLLREVLGKQSAWIRDCLLASSVLDRFCMELLDTICASPDINQQPGFAASDFLEELLRNNLFTIPLDAGGKWFRYHHLFQDLLVGELQHVRGPDYIAALRLRASEWFEGVNLIDEAIQQALAAEDMERAAELIARNRHEALNESQWYILDRWLALVPPQTVMQHAELVMARAWITLNYNYQVEAVPPLLAEVESLVGDKSGYEQVRGELALCRGYIYWLIGNGAESLQQLDVGLEQIPIEHTELRSNGELVFAQAKQMVGRKEEGLRFLDDLLASSGSPEVMREARLTMARVFIYLVDGDLLGAEVANRRMWELVKRGFPAYVRIWTNYMQGVIHLQRCEWEAAIEHLGRSVENRFIHHARAAVDSMAGLMFAHLALGQEDDAETTLKKLKGYVASLADPAMENLAISVEARMAILQGRPAAARRWLEETEPSPEGAFFWFLAIPSITRCQTLMAARSPDSLLIAEARLRECTEVVEAQHNNFQLIRILALLSMVCERQCKTEEALEILEQAVTLARGGNLFLPFVELGTPMVDLLNRLSTESEFVTEVERLVDALDLPSHSFAADEVGAVKPPPPILDEENRVAGRNCEELTNRELDILDLLAQRLQNKEIASRLNISYHTVDSHLKQIYHKLGVHGRRKAVEAAIKSGILKLSPAE
ncbi:LuxR C-terminal-related transcriptional regulator [Kaarinaea lacus]